MGSDCGVPLSRVACVFLLGVFAWAFLRISAYCCRLRFCCRWRLCYFNFSFDGYTSRVKLTPTARGRVFCEIYKDGDVGARGKRAYDVLMRRFNVAPSGG